MYVTCMLHAMYLYLFNGCEQVDILSLQSCSIGVDVLQRVVVVAWFGGQVQQVSVGGEVPAQVQLYLSMIL